MSDLARTKVDKFNIENSINLDELNLETAKKHLILIENVFENYLKIELNNKELALFLNGVMLTNFLNNGVYKIYNNNNFIGLGVIKNKLLKRDVII